LWNKEEEKGFNNYNRFAMLSRVINIFCYNLNNRHMLREVMVKIGLEDKELIHKKR